MWHKSETGRSMIEMLGVLAIIGVLSIGGLSGYTRAMRMNKINNAIEYMNRAWVEFKAKKAAGQIVSKVGYPCAILLDEDLPAGMDRCQFQSHYGTDYNGRILVHFDSFDLYFDVAEKLHTQWLATARQNVQDGLPILKLSLMSDGTNNIVYQVSSFRSDAFDSY